MPPVTRSKCSCSKVKNEVVECPTTFFTTFSEEDIARIEKHQKRVQKYRSETVESGGCDYIPQGDRILVTKTEADDSLEDVFLTPPSSPIVHRSVVLRGCDVLGLWDYLWRTEDNENGAALGRIVKTFENGDLLNKPLVLWLIVRSTPYLLVPLPDDNPVQYDRWVLGDDKHKLSASICMRRRD